MGGNLSSELDQCWSSLNSSCWCEVRLLSSSLKTSLEELVACAPTSYSSVAVTEEGIIVTGTSSELSWVFGTTVRKVPEIRPVILDLRFRKGILWLRGRDERDGGGSDLLAFLV